MSDVTNTPFSSVYNSFLSKITDDMFMELTPANTEAIMQDLYVSAVQKVRFPKKILLEYDLATEDCGIDLTNEEINIIATYMIVEWLGQQLASIENTRMKYSGTDFKFTSQANHMTKIRELKIHYAEEGLHLQNLYKRREVNDEGKIGSTFYKIMGYESATE